MAVKLKLPINYEIPDDQMSQMSYLEGVRYSNWRGRCISFFKAAVPIATAIFLIAITEILALGETWESVNNAIAGAVLWAGLGWAGALNKWVFHLPVTLNIELFLGLSQVWDNGNALIRSISIQMIEFLFGIQIAIFVAKFVLSKRENDPTDGIDIEKKNDRNYIEMLWGNTARSQVISAGIKVVLGGGAMYGSKWAVAPFRRFLIKMGRILIGSGVGKAANVALFVALYRAEKQVLNRLGQDRFTSADQRSCVIKVGRIVKTLFWVFGYYVFGIIGLDTPPIDFISGFCRGIKESMDAFCYTHTPLTELVDIEGDAEPSRQKTLSKVAHFALGAVAFGYLTWQGVIAKLLEQRLALGLLGASITGSILTAKWIRAPRAGSPISKVHATIYFYCLFSSPSLLLYNATLQVIKVNSQAMNEQAWKEMILTMFAYSILGGASGLHVYRRLNPKKHLVIPSYTPNDDGHSFFSQYLVTWLTAFTNSPGLK
ncbi:MAG: hypothetical protein AAF443_02570 [Chlamydiota bacterium]